MPPLCPEFHDTDKRDVLDGSLKKDIAWSLAEGIDECTEIQPEAFLGSWTYFKKDASNLMFEYLLKYLLKSIVEYLPMVSEPPEYRMQKVSRRSVRYHEGVRLRSYL